MNKRAMELSFLVTVIILLVIVLLIVLYYAKFSKVTGEFGDIEVCKESNEINALLRVAGEEMYDDVKCPTTYTTVENLEEDEVKQVLAEEMAKCWYKMGEGRLELFDIKRLQTETSCVVCGVVEFEGDNKMLKMDDFIDYLSVENVPLVYSFSGKYAEYLLPGYVTDTSMSDKVQTGTSGSIDTSYDYATVFVYSKYGKVDDVTGASTGAAVGLGAGLLLMLVPDVTVTKAAGIALISGSLGGIAGYELGTEDTAKWASGVVLYPYTTDAINSLNCDILPLKQTDY